MKSDISSLLENLTGFIEAKIELLKLDIKEDSSRFIADSVIYLVLFFMAMGFLLFINLALANYLNAVLSSLFIGYFIIAGIYLLFFVLTWALYKNKKVKRYIDNFVYGLFRIKNSK